MYAPGAGQSAGSLLLFPADATGAGAAAGAVAGRGLQVNDDAMAWRGTGPSSPAFTQEAAAAAGARWCRVQGHGVDEALLQCPASLVVNA